MDSKENKPTTNLQELVEAVRAIQREKLAVLEQKQAEMLSFRYATHKLSPQQKYILKWLWGESCKREVYLEANDIHSAEFVANIEQLRKGLGRLDLENAHGDRQQWQSITDYQAAVWYHRSEKGVRWDIISVTRDDITNSKKASVSRSLRGLISRGLVKRCHVRTFEHYISLTPLGRTVSKLLTDF